VTNQKIFKIIIVVLLIFAVLSLIMVLINQPDFQGPASQPNIKGPKGPPPEKVQ